MTPSTKPNGNGSPSWKWLAGSLITLLAAASLTLGSSAGAALLRHDKDITEIKTTVTTELRHLREELARQSSSLGRIERKVENHVEQRH